MFFDHPRPGKIQGAVAIKQHFFRFCELSSEEVRFVLTRTACQDSARPRPDRRRRRDYDVSRGLNTECTSLFRAEFLSTNTARICSLALLLTQHIMFQGGWLTTRTCDVREPPIPHRTRLAHGRRSLVPLVPSTRRLPLQPPCRIRRGAGAGRRDLDARSATRPRRP